MSGSRDAHREPQDRACPAGWQSFLGRLPKPPENAKIAFRWGWHKLEMTQPLKRPAQTRQPPPAPASSIETRRCWLGTTPSRRPVGTAYDRARIGTRTARTSPERISGPRLSRRGAQAGGGLPTIESCYRRFDRGLKNAIFAFQPPWYKFEMRCPLVRPSQTHLRRSARAPTDRGTWGLGEGVLGSNRAPTILVIAFQPPLVLLQI